MTKKLYTWDELSNEISDRDPAELFERNAEGGWVTEGWSEDQRVEIRTNGRHTALECWAGTEEEAQALFAKFEVYRDYQEE